MLHASFLTSLPGITHGFGVRGVAIEECLVAAGLARCVHARTNQVHGNRVHRLGPAGSDGILQGDAFMTDEPGVVCHVRTADCVPIIIADGRSRAVAAVHAGWRGTAVDVAGRTIREMARAFGTAPADCMAAIGPRICGACYEVGGEVARGLEALAIGDAWRLPEGRVDLGAANAALLERAGIRRERIEMLPHCTRCDERFASYRRDRTDAERQVNFIVING